MIKAGELALNFLINSIWQIAAISLATSICVCFLKNVPARYQHGLWVTALIMSLALPIWSVVRINSQAPEQLAVKLSAGTAQNNYVSQQTQDSANTVDQVNAGAPAVSTPISINKFIPKRSQAFAATPALLLVVSFLYAGFLFYQALRLWRQWRKTNALRRTTYFREVPERVRQIATKCSAAFGLPDISIVCSSLSSAPGVVGARNPIIILPEEFFEELPDETLYSILGHELAHVARRDYQWNVVYEFLLLPISFHPLARFLKRQIARTRELACDEMVTEKLLEPVVHARSLVKIAGALIGRADQVLTLGIFDGNILEERIMKLTRHTGRAGLRLRRLLALSSGVFLCASFLAISAFSFELRTKQDGKASSAFNSTSQSLSSPEVGAFGQRDQNTAAIPNGPQASGLRSSDAQARAQAACDAGRQQLLSAMPQLISMLGDDAKVEPIPCWTNGRWSPALSSFKHPSPGEQAAIALASMGTPAFEVLTAALNDQDSVVRRNAAWAIGELTNMLPNERSDAVAPLIALLNDSDAWVRMAAARALGELRDERSGDPLVTRLSDENGRVREISAWALGEMKDDRAVQKLCSLLVSDLQPAVRFAAAEALGEIRSPKALPSLKQALSDAEPLVRYKAKWAIAEIDDSDG